MRFVGPAPFKEIKMNESNRGETPQYQMMYKCHECGNLHEDYDLARECCPVWIEEVYACSVCMSEQNTEGEAVACCSEEKEQKEALPSLKELEAAGQKRLFG